MGLSNRVGANISSNQLNKTITLEINITNANSGYFSIFLHDTERYIYSAWAES